MTRPLDWNHILWAYEHHLRRWASEGKSVQQIRDRLREENIYVSVSSIRAVLKGRGV